MGQPVQYVDADGTLHPAIVKAVHTDDPTAKYYTIVITGGAERQTSRERLRSLEASTASEESSTASREVRVEVGVRCRAGPCVGAV